MLIIAELLLNLKLFVFPQRICTVTRKAQTNLYSFTLKFLLAEINCKSFLIERL